MIKVLVINGSPRMEKGYTALLLDPFIQGMKEAGAEVELFYAHKMEIGHCTGEMYCWYEKPGACYIQDDMQVLYPKLWECDILVIATPVYIPLPARMQCILKRLCPLIKPLLETREGRTRARFHEDVKIQRIALVSTGGWWELENFATVVGILKEFAETAGVQFAGAVLRPHALLLKKKGRITREGETVLNAVKKAGHELVIEGKMRKETLATISYPLISREELIVKYNNLVQ